MPESNDTTPPLPTAPPSDDSAVAGPGDDTSDGRSAQGHGAAPAGFGPPVAPDEVGTLGTYRVVRKLGAGNMGAVYLALDTRLNRWVALKVMLAQAAGDPNAKDRFVREARAAAQLMHDNVVMVFDADERAGVPYIAMQLLRGRSLDDFLKSGGKLDLRHALRVVRETALALAFAHAAGVIHRDIKPANLWLEEPGGRVKVVDFGLAKQLGSDPDLTRTGVPIGTPRYMSPEQARGLKVDHRSDLFSLGSVLYLLCTGTYAFDGPHAMAVLTALIADDPVPVREVNADVPEPVAQLIHQLLAKKVDRRVQSAQEVVARIDAILAGPPSGSAPAVVLAPLPSCAVEALPLPAHESGWKELPRTDGSKKVEPVAPSAPSPLERLPTGRVTIDELLELSADPRTEVPLWVNAAEIWPVVKAALDRAEVRKAFRDIIAERVAELWDEAVRAIRGNDRRAWAGRWDALRSVAPARTKELLGGLLDNESVVAELRTSTQTWSLVLMACAEAKLPPPPPRRGTPSSPAVPPVVPPRGASPTPSWEGMLGRARGDGGATVLWEEAGAALLGGDYRGWELRWAVLREVFGREEVGRLLRELVAGEKNEERLSRLPTDVRARLRSACADVELLPPSPLLVPIGSSELEPLLAGPTDWAGYTAFVTLAPDNLNWLARIPAHDRTQMRKRAREFLFVAPAPAVAAFVHTARPYFDTDPAFLTVLFEPYSPAGAALMDRLLTTKIAPDVWLKFCTQIGLTQDEWGEFLLENDRLANLLVGLGGDGVGKEVWGAYLELLTPALVSPALAGGEGAEPAAVHAWERKVHAHLKTAAERLVAAGHRLARALPEGGVSRLFAANNLLKWVNNPGAAERDDPEEVRHACDTFGMDRLDLVRAAYRTGGYAALDLPAELAELEPILFLFCAAFPPNGQYNNSRATVNLWLKLSADCPKPTRAAFQAHFVLRYVPRAYHADLLNEQLPRPFEPLAEYLVRQRVDASNRRS